MARPNRFAVHLLPLALLLTTVSWASATTATAAPPPSTPTTSVEHVSESRATATHASTVQVPAPSGTSAGDLLLARVANRGDVTATMTSDGWSPVGSTHSAGLLKATVLYKVVGADEPRSYRFDVSSKGSLLVTVSAFSGVDPAQPVDTFAGMVNGNSSSLRTPPVKASDADLVVWFGTQLWSETDCPDSAVTPPAGFTETADGCLPVEADGLSYDVAYRQLAAAGTYAGWTGSSDVAATNVAQAVALRPAGSVTAAIAHRATTTAEVADAAAVTLPVPSSTQPGDVLLVRVANRNHPSSDLSAPRGWTLVRHDHSAYSVGSWVYVRVATADEPKSWTFGIDDRQTLVGSLSAYAGVDVGDPVDTSSSRTNGSSVAFVSAPVTPTTPGSIAVWFGVQAEDASACPAAVGLPDGFIDRGGRCEPGVGDGLLSAVADRSLPDAGASEVFRGSSTLATTNLTQVVVLRPAGAGSSASAPAPAQGTGYADHSVDVGELWTPRPNGSHQTAFPDKVLHEPSGLASSRVNKGVVYVDSESDVHGMVAVSTTDAEVVGEYDVPIPQQWDWEDIATGPCPTGSCIFAGDIGLYNGKPNPPSTFSVYRVPEPDLAAGKTSGTLTGDWFRFRYPDGPHNAEALMVHPTTGAVYVVTKEQSGLSGVYTFPNPMPAPSATTVTTLTKLTTLHVPVWTGDPGATSQATWYAQVSAGAIHPAGDRFILRTPYQVLEYRAPAGQPFESAFDADPVRVTAPTGEGQGEAIDYAADGSAYFTLSEEPAPPFVLKRVDRS